MLQESTSVPSAERSECASHANAVHHPLCMIHKPGHQERQLFQVHQGKPIASIVVRLAQSAKTLHGRYTKNNIITITVLHNTVIKSG